MNKSRKFLPALTAVGLALAVSMAQASPLDFGFSAATITPGTGYGVDDGANLENGGTLLDVFFDKTFTMQNFALVAGGAGYKVNLGTIDFREPNTGSPGNIGIRGQETNDLNVIVSLTFDLPTPRALDFAAIVTAVSGTIADSDIDYALAWTARAGWIHRETARRRRSSRRCHPRRGCSFDPAPDPRS